MALAEFKNYVLYYLAVVLPMWLYTNKVVHIINMDIVEAKSVPRKL